MEQETFGNEFNQPIIDVIWPSVLQQLTIECNSNQPLINVTLPHSLQQLTLGYTFIRSLINAKWPPSLRQLTFGHKSNQTIDDFLRPELLENHDMYGDCFEQSLDNAKRPVSLVILILREGFNSVDGREVADVAGAPVPWQ